MVRKTRALTQRVVEASTGRRAISHRSSSSLQLHITLVTGQWSGGGALQESQGWQGKEVFSSFDLVKV